MPKAQVFEVKVAFNLYNNKIDDKINNINLSNISKRLCSRYRDFFNVHKAEQQSPHQPTNHIIELKSDTEPSYMRTYNMSPAELKALDIYLNNTLVKGWI